MADNWATTVFIWPKGDMAAWGSYCWYLGKLNGVATAGVPFACEEGVPAAPGTLVEGTPIGIEAP